MWYIRNTNINTSIITNVNTDTNTNIKWNSNKNSSRNSKRNTICNGNKNNSTNSNNNSKQNTNNMRNTNRNNRISYWQIQAYLCKLKMKNRAKHNIHSVFLNVIHNILYEKGNKPWNLSLLEPLREEPGKQLHALIWQED